MTERAAYLALSRIGGKRRLEARELLAELGSARAVWSRMGLAGPDPEAELARAMSRPGRMIVPTDAEYPPNLAQLEDYPLVLFLRGLPLPPEPLVAVVGSRMATPYGLVVAERLGRDLARSGVSVVSGLARGVDTAAHRGALRFPESHPVAVLGCGLDHDYPAENRPLKDLLERHGTLVSEYPPSEPPVAWHFPARNRILAGLCRAVVVVEASERSGALITARCALNAGREVMVVPGDVGQPTSRGTFELLRDGATPVACAAHILESLFVREAPRETSPLEPDLARVLAGLSPRGSSADELVQRTRLSITQVLAALGRLQVEGRVRRFGSAFLPLDE